MTINFLQKGDLVDVISPSSPITKNDYKKIATLLAKKGLRARFHLAEKLLLDKAPKNNFAQASAKTRFDQLQFALENKDSKAIWCVRGGYGALDLVPFFKNLKTAPSKIFIGFSDITTIGIMLNQKLNLPLIYGAMLRQLTTNSVTKSSQKQIFDFVFGDIKTLKYKLKVLKKSSQKKISAPLIGGCLSVVMSNFLTTNEIDFNNKIFLLEDIDEAGERLDRYFEQLLQIMILTKKYPKAILFGNYKQEAKTHQDKANIDIAINNFVTKIKNSKLDIAIFSEKKSLIGHSKNISPIILGQIATIENESLIQQI